MIVETNPVNNIVVEAPQITIVGQPFPATCNDCASCNNCPNCNNNCPCNSNCQTCSSCPTCNNNCCPECEVIVEKPCSCTEKPCNCGHEVITTVEIIETCPNYDEIIQNDEVVGTNQTYVSTYNISETEYAQQLIDYQNLQNGRINFCNIKQDEEQPTVIGSNDTSVRKKKPVVANIVNQHNNQPIQECVITSGWHCRKHGVYPHPTSCQKYIQCNFCGANTVYSCAYDESFDGKRCSSDWSTCDALKDCQFDRELIVDPWNKAQYFICVRKKGFHDNFFVFRRHCPDGLEFDVVRQQCVCIKVVVVVKPKPTKPCKKCGSNHG